VSFRRLILGGALGFALLSALLVAPSALGDARRLELSAIRVQFTSFTCLDNSCSLARATIAGAATSNLATGTGSFTGTLIVDFSPGGSCNIVDESDAFSFANGTISVHSNHEDCATQGLRIDTTFDVTGGTSDFQGATGGGREKSSAAAPPAITYIGTISF
jgi:hypothetical protein